jgi:hypothetical protein
MQSIAHKCGILVYSASRRIQRAKPSLVENQLRRAKTFHAGNQLRRSKKEFGLEKESRQVLGIMCGISFLF